MNLKRHFLFLQGPHGPFFSELAELLVTSGVRTSRVAFNGGDAAFWRDPRSLWAFRDDLSRYEDWLSRRIERERVSDLVLYGEPRPAHAVAVSMARGKGLKTHMFEEGYLRPYWITYEREGTNGASRLMSLKTEKILELMRDRDNDLPEAPATWGEMRQHVFYGVAYHARVVLGRRGFSKYQSHRGASVESEFALYLRRLLSMPVHDLRRRLSTTRLKRGGFPFHLVLLQLSHDASFRRYAGFDRIEDLVAVIVRGFAEGAPRHHHLVFKAHPLEDGRVPLAREIRKNAKAFGIGNRVHFQVGGKLAWLLDAAASVVTANSTGAQQALWRGLPVKAFGQAVYSKPEFVSDQPIAAFFAAPQKPDLAAYRTFRQFLLSTSQFRGGFYSARGRQTLLRTIVDAMLDDVGPYEKLERTTAAPPQHVRLIG